MTIHPTETPLSDGIIARLSRSRAVISVVAGAIGGVSGFVMSRTVDSLSATDESQLRLQQGLWFALVVLSIGAALIAANYIQARRRPDLVTIAVASGSLLVIGFIAGYLAQILYSAILDPNSLNICFVEYHADRDDSALNWCYANTVRIGRAVGWAVAGGLAGVAIGVTFRSLRRCQNGVIGGAVGGLLGGLLFDSIPALLGVSSLWMSQLLALIIIGGLIGGLTSIIESVRTQMWIEIISGESNGRRFPIVDPVTRIGSARTIDLPIIGDRLVRELHARLVVDETGATLFSEISDPIVHNGQPTKSVRLSDGDRFVIGATELRVLINDQTPASNAVPATNTPNAAAVRRRLPVGQGDASSSQVGPTSSPSAPPSSSAPGAQAGPRQRPRLSTKDK